MRIAITLAAATIVAATSAFAQPKTTASMPPSSEKACQLTSLNMPSESAEAANFNDSVSKKLTDAGCRAGDIISLHSFRVQSLAVARLCDFRAAIYTDSATFVCRWTGIVRPNVDVR